MEPSLDPSAPSVTFPPTRGYQQELLDESLRRNLVVALDTGSGKTHIAILRMKIEAERESEKVSWFLAPTVALCEQQRNVIMTALPVAVGLISGALEPDQWRDPALWRRVLREHRVMVSTPQVLLDALRHGYVSLGLDINLLVFDEAHHAVRDDPYNRIMKEFYFDLPSRHHTLPASVPLHVGQRVPVRPMILGLTASPIFSGNDIEREFGIIEANLDSTIRSSQRYRDELAKFVHKPVFKHAWYSAPDYSLKISASHNLNALHSVMLSMDIENDPYVQSLRQQLAAKSRGSTEWFRIDQKLTKAVMKQNTYTHKGLKEFYSAADAICVDVGPWAADWYIQKVLEQAQMSATPYKNVLSTWQNKEKTYLLNHLAQIDILPISYEPDSIVAGTTSKVQVLIECLLTEEAATVADDESYRGLVFVTRRDTVLALAEVLSHHPRNSGLFDVGCLLGTSESAYRHSFLDISRRLLNRSQAETLGDFDIGEKNLLIATSVAEEGIDIQACGSVIRWDPPANMVSWAQSRGRARRKKSTFTLLVEDSGIDQDLVARWGRLEQQMTDLYNDVTRASPEEDITDENEDEDEDLKFHVKSTGAVIGLKSVVAHLNHFCSILPNTSHGAHLPIYDIDPPDFPVGWHSFDNRFRTSVPPYLGPFGSTVTLPRMLPPALRTFSVDRIYTTKRSAHRHAAFKAYVALYNAGLLNDHLLPLTSVLDPELEEEVKSLLKDIDKRSGTAEVAGQLDPWIPEDGSDAWRAIDLVIKDLPPLRMFTRVRITTLADDELPVLYRLNQDPLTITLQPSEMIVSFDVLEKARNYTRQLFWSLPGSRMNWNDLDFAYLFLPVEVREDTLWDERCRTWLNDVLARGLLDPESAFFANAEIFGKHFSFPEDLTLIRSGIRSSQTFQFLRWKFDPASEEEKAELLARYSRFDNLQVTPPLLVVQPLPRRRNFLIPITTQSKALPHEKAVLLLPRFATVNLLSSVDIEYGLLLPSIIRFLSMSITTCSLRDTLLSHLPTTVPLGLLTMAATAPASQEHINYQRLETLGDTVLKFCVGVQLMSEYPLWHQGYLTKRKDHAVSNVRLAKDAHSKRLYRWIIRDRFTPRKWRPKYLTVSFHHPETTQEESGSNPKDQERKQELSTKVLADVVESMIGAAYLHAGFDLAIDCIKVFGLGLKWEPLSLRVENILARVEPATDFPTQITDVERMLGYTFTRKLLLVEALVHASHQQDLRTVSYERMEFLGDSVLDMVVTEYLYRAPGKEYGPGALHLHKSAVVNAHFLAYICLQCTLPIDASMPHSNGRQGISVVPENQEIYLWQCLLHSSHRVLDDQRLTFARYQRGKGDIEAALTNGLIFPWAALTRLQAPKFLSDMIESLLGAVYLDSQGDFDAVRLVLTNLRILPLLERIVHDDVDVLHPVSRVSVWAAKHSKEIEYVFEKEGGRVTCIIKVDTKERVRKETTWRSHASQEEVKFAAAERMIEKLHLMVGDSDEGEEDVDSDIQ